MSSCFADVEAVLGISTALTNCCRKVGAFHRVDGQSQGYDAVATVNRLQVLRICSCLADVETVLGISRTLADDMAYCLSINSSFEVRCQCRILRYPNGARVIRITIIPCNKAITRFRSGSQNPLIASLSDAYINTTRCQIVCRSSKFKRKFFRRIFQNASSEICIPITSDISVKTYT